MDGLRTAGAIYEMNAQRIVPGDLAEGVSYRAMECKGQRFHARLFRTCQARFAIDVYQQREMRNQASAGDAVEVVNHVSAQPARCATREVASGTINCRRAIQTPTAKAAMYWGKKQN